ncbi:putative bifunctional diguanylate cyclase/phosphodiesterase [Pengzhenrongella sicca]|uniref:Bifunctional diguanylate cyclase/phosphodiesterase n=1 Tax=Pengzhenrongella sicca TaxID=2819238 RepID=A0A8A4ZJF2_9MICO|nr:bifunctional diguanylate cyclase/phosphodiesterase [Pengzhenrongella sicca]QTE31173.1 bifunctional diguanylate cyclase/phosphodiesterase [Pengzhenrongella sicca]
MHGSRWSQLSRLAPVSVITLASSACFVLGANRPGSAALLAQQAVAIVVLAASGAVLWTRAGSRGDDEGSERGVWRALAAAVFVAAVGATAQAALDWARFPIGADQFAVRSAVFGASTLVACPLLYQALIRWNRARGLVGDPDDWLNGLSAVFALAAIVNLVLWHGGGALADLPWWVVQGSVFRLGVTFVLLGTTVTVSFIAGLHRDARIWGIGAALAVILGSEVAALRDVGAVSPDRPLLLGWVAAAALLAWCTVLSPTRVRPRPATARATAVGAVVVLLASVAVLIIHGEGLARSPGAHGHGYLVHAPNVLAALAVLGITVRLVHLIRDMALLAQTRQEARTDALTGVANRRALMARLTESGDRGGPLSLLVIDLDRFKDVNDRYGHPTGDALLRSAATRFAAVVPAGGLLARLGSDEFAVLLPGDAATAEGVAAALSDEARAIADIAGHPVRTSVSIGLAAGAPDLDGEELLRRADAAMFLAKSGGGGGVSRYDSEIDRADRDRGTRVEELRAALDLGRPDPGEQFVIYYQPQVDVRSLAVTGVEALVRWQHPGLGLLAPGEFIDLVEKYGLMPELTARVLGEAAAQAARWQADGVPLRMSVNISTSFLTHPELLPLLDTVLASTALDPALLVLEVTETTLMADAVRGLEAAHAIAARGVGLSIDDYGTGYSSLAYLNDLPATELKLDQSFVSRLVVDDRTAAIVAATIELAHRLGLRSIAEGVEDDATLAVLETLGCDECQGYLHSRPRPIASLEPWLRARRALLARRGVLGASATGEFQLPREPPAPRTGR